MTLNRRDFMQGAAALASTGLAGGVFAQQAGALKISHQFPGGSATEGDFRDRMCDLFAAEIGKRSKGSLAAEVYPNSSLVKTVAQFSAIRKGALDMTLYPLNYAGGEVPEVNIGFMPAVVSSYDQGYKWKTAEIGKKMTNLLADKGVILVSWLWQAGGAASRGGPRYPLRCVGTDKDKPCEIGAKFLQRELAMCPAYSDANAKPLSLLLDSGLDLHIELTVDGVDVIKDDSDLLAVRRLVADDGLRISKPFRNFRNALSRFFTDARLAGERSRDGIFGKSDLVRDTLDGHFRLGLHVRLFSRHRHWIGLRGK